MMIIAVLTVFFIALGVIVPLAQDSFSQTTISNDVDGLSDGLSSGRGESSPTNFISVMWSVFTMFFWTFGSLPTMFDLIFMLPLRILYFYVLLSDVIVNIIPFT